MNLSYKICSIEDLDVLVKISLTTFVSAFEKLNNPDDFKLHLNKAFSISKIKSELLNKNSFFYFVFSDNMLAGYFKLNQKEAQTEPLGDKALELERIYVTDDFQKQGIGAKILQEVIEMAKQKHMDYLWLGVWEHNTAAMRFYERNGFEKFGTHAFYIGTDKQIEWLMKLDLV
ncbi:spermine/spermidine N-acetyltransferase [Flavobacteriaceae bacterium MAR_2010_72]|nr:spermine/spermidine N-acetyltransferase [Flavobacteriaceae bacterium MAR_2010_72]